MFIARTIPIYYKFVRTGETADLFHSFAPDGNELICAFRRHRIVDFSEWGTGENFYESRTMVQRFDVTDGTPISEPEEAMAMGEDPRCVSIEGRPFILSANPCGGKFNYVLFDIQNKRALNVEVTNRANFKYGKNWQPFVVEGKLYAVHGFSPFRILRIDVETGQAEVVFEKDVGLDVVSPHDGFTQFRGGCSAVVVRDHVVGFGHLTMDSGRHSAFQWVFSPSNGQVSLSFDLDIRPLADLGLKIIDPTCFFAFQEKLYLGVSCSNRDWFYGQTFVSLLLEVQTEGNSLRTNGTLASALNRALPLQENRGLSNPTVHFYRAAELQIGNGIRSQNFEVVSRAGKDDAGHIIYGPYLDLSSGSYQLRLQYASAAPSSQEVGEMDACGSSGSNVLGKKQLFGTDGKLFMSTVDFRIPEDRQGLGFEARVGSKGIADMRLTDISISRL
jgi:hypothetical protein